MVNIDPKKLTRIIRNIYGKSEDKFIPLHEPRFISDEKEVLIDCIDSTFVSTVGRYVAIFEDTIKTYTGAKYAIATSNGTSALHVALIACGVMPKDEVITQAFTFIATCNPSACILVDQIFSLPYGMRGYPATKALRAHA